MKNIFKILLLFSTFCSFSQTVMQAEYFWDTDPGEGNGNALQVLNGNFNQVIKTVFSNNAMLPSVGNHIIGIRIKGQEGNWSPVFRKTFKVSATNNTNNLVKITTAEYYWDNDPGEGAGNIMLAFDGNFNQALETVLSYNVSLPNIGQHVIGIRVKADDGNWGSTFRKVFRVSEDNNSNTLVKVTTAEYFWNNDPGQGNGHIMLAFDGNFNQALETIVASSAILPNAGLNLLNIRIKADDGNWGTVFAKVVGMDITYNNQVILTSPTNETIAVPLDSSFVWEQLTGAGSYEYQCSVDSNFDSIVQSGIVDGHSVDFSSLQNNTTYYWRVRANVSGNVSLWSNIWSFTTGSNLNAPDFETTNEIRIYPNPAQNYITIKSTSFLDYYGYKVYGIEGKKVLEGKIYPTETINIEKLPRGTYMIKCTSTDGMNKTSKFIKL